MDTNQALYLAEILSGAATPLAVLVVGAVINRSIKRMEMDKEAIFKIKEMRRQMYEDICEQLNVIACFVADVGDFGEYTPDQIMAFKRRIDRRMFSYRSLWSDETIRLYDQFISSCFEHYAGGIGTPAKFKGSATEKRAYFSNTGREWDDAWDHRFTGSTDREIMDKYHRLTSALTGEFVD